LPWSHHRLSSCLSTGLNQSAFTVSTSKFFNRIGQSATFIALCDHIIGRARSAAGAV